MANIDLLNPMNRKMLIDDIRSNENVERKRKSLKDYEIYNDNAYPYVYEKLANQLSEQTAAQMPIVSNLNIAKAVVQKEANIYTDEPERNYSNITESDEKAIEEIYADGGFNSILGKANKYYKLRNQSFIQVVPKYGKLKLRVLHGHNIDVIPDSDDPEMAYAFIISSFDKSSYLQAGQDNTNQITADTDDYKAKSERYQIWTSKIVFTMDGKGNILTEFVPNPIGSLPFIDIAKDKDFEFFVRIGQALTDFTVDFNVSWSDLLYIARLQGYSVGVVSGDPELKPESMTVGPNRFLFLPQNPANENSNLTLEFKNPTPNLEATLKAIDSLIATFLTTRGVDAKAVSTNNSGNTSYSSALERLLAMIDQFRASKEDFDLFSVVEKKLHQIVVKYLSLLSGTEFLDSKYSTSQAVINSEMSIQFKKPEMIETKSEQLDNAKKKMDLGIADAVSVLAEIDGISDDEAMEEIAEINQRKLDNMQSVIEATSPEASIGAAETNT